ncbi:hypothetical protein CNBB5210 [Cryptococcus deneoformans B-3501A]|uniref:Pol II transcription elongation factor, putative n=1 Tax=Cryptococcus deneoformans (strain JEC21 / ATCC MYA-565) TaxID=214684 RepID=Q5KMU2_CRYD1|nr:Pol II transcription elongation factor, putative [Cryptococcus neoformans var. neoformans JEC21]XP_776994.1 hypothetical protein CNBB5210 [Cryptococcus neoformans var. neoformans B-3501A]AAW41751.1 Pol II transcription elongation factor, putative [Cryptococcus neoformans var. neoformans JEC21]EAL22347.1 hypothetical protein CNBB5210 [Cryptococcus neoformans var. neoformans B-3501A]
MSNPARVILLVGKGGVQTDVDLDSLAQDEVADIIPVMLADYESECRDWTLIASEHWREGRWNRVMDLLERAVSFFNGERGRRRDSASLINIHSMLAHLHLHLARSAPKVILQNAKYDKLDPSIRTKDYHHREAAASLNAATEALRASGGSQEDEPVSLTMGKVIHYLATGQPGLAHPLVERLLQRQPNNLMALTAQARLQFARRSHLQALQTYQKLLTLAPEMSPDPRIGLGLCFWQLGDRAKARTAWERALEREPGSWVCLLLLGLASLNDARQPSIPRTERLKLETEGVGFVQKAFKLNNKSSASALALASVSGQGGQSQLPLASKLAERAVQYADNKRHAVLANSERGRLGFMAGDLADAGTYIAAVKKEDPNAVNIIAELTLGQMAIKSGNLREALNYIEQTAKRLNGQGPLEYTVLHACLLAYPHPGMSHDEVVRNRTLARNMLTEVHNLVASAETEADWAKLRGVGSDADVFVDLAKLWQGENVEKAIGAYQTALSIITDNDLDSAQEPGLDPPSFTALRLSDNLGALYHLEGNVETAERMYQEALQKIATQEGKEAETLKTVLAYNLGRAYEEGGDHAKAAQWYRDVLRQHPEHVESKVRLALIATSAGRHFDAHTLLKECLQSDENNLILRSVYTNFLITIGSYREAFAFTTQTLKVDKSDAWTFCALGWLHFTLGREAKSPQELAERPKQYLRSAEAYERALIIDPKCAMAAQGLAIALVEDSLALRGTNYGAEEGKVRARLAGQTLGIFGRIKDSLAEGAVNVNLGHCYFIRGEEEKAIESYMTASNAFDEKDVNVLLYLARAWYALANRESNFSAMNKALDYCQKAMHIHPADRAILYNIAMIQQKAAEMLFSLDCSKRTLEELTIALKQAQQAVDTFRSLADDRSGSLPYDAELADQRARYGEGLLRRAAGEMTKQEAYQGEALARVEEARRLRAEEQARIQAAEEARQAELRIKAEEIAEQRRKAREEAQAWQEELAARQAEEEARRAAIVEKRKRRKEGIADSGEDGEGEGRKREKKPRKKKTKEGKKGRKVRSKSEVGTTDEEEEARETGDDEDEETSRARKAKSTLAMLKAKRKARRADPDDDEEEDEDEVNQGQAKRGKQFKSKAYISDSDDENDEAPVSASRPGSEEPLHQKDDEREQSEAHTPAKSQNDEDSGMDVDQNGNDEDEDE